MRAAFPSLSTPDAISLNAADRRGHVCVSFLYTHAAHWWFFRHHRGRLDLRAINRLDLDRVVREVDIDALQVGPDTIGLSPNPNSQQPFS